MARAEESVGLFALFAIPYTLCEARTALLNAASMAGSSELLKSSAAFLSCASYWEEASFIMPRSWPTRLCNLPWVFAAAPSSWEVGRLGASAPLPLALTRFG